MWPGNLGKEASVLNRDIHWVDAQGITVTADGRHVKVMVEKLQCKHMSKLKVPMAKSKHETDETNEKELTKRKAEGSLGKKEDDNSSPLLSPELTALYEAVAARANHLSSDRAGTAYTIKELCRRMSEPREACRKLLERLTRYLMSFHCFANSGFVFKMLL